MASSFRLRRDNNSHSWRFPFPPSAVYYPLTGGLHSNLERCKQQHGIRLSGSVLGRPKKNSDEEKRLAYLDECDRVEVERCLSLAKRKCGMGLVTAKLRETAAHVIAMSILVLNLRKIQRAVLRLWLLLFGWCFPSQKTVFVQ